MNFSTKMAVLTVFLILTSACFAQSKQDTLVWIQKDAIIYNAKKAVEDNKMRIKMFEEENLRYEGQLLFFSALKDSVQVWVRKPE